MNQIKNSIRIIKKKISRNKLVLSRFFTPTFISVVLVEGMLRLYLFFYVFRSFQEQENKRIPLLAKLLNPNTGDELALFLSILEISSLIMMVAGAAYLFFFSVLSLKRERILEETELRVKASLGVSPKILTFEFIGESMVTMIVASVMSIGLVNLLYTSIYILFQSSWVAAYLIAPLTLFVHYDLVSSGLLLLFLTVLTGHTYFRIKNQYYNYRWKRS